MGYSHNSLAEASFQELKDEYVRYFKMVSRDNVGGRNRIRHVKACLELVKEGKLERVGKEFRLKKTKV